MFLEDGEIQSFLDQPVAVKNSKEDRAHKIVVVVECLHMLNKLSDAIEVKPWKLYIIEVYGL